MLVGHFSDFFGDLGPQEVLSPEWRRSSEGGYLCAAWIRSVIFLYDSSSSATYSRGVENTPGCAFHLSTTYSLGIGQVNTYTAAISSSSLRLFTRKIPLR